MIGVSKTLFHAFAYNHSTSRVIIHFKWTHEQNERQPAMPHTHIYNDNKNLSNCCAKHDETGDYIQMDHSFHLPSSSSSSKFWDDFTISYTEWQQLNKERNAKKSGNNNGKFYKKLYYFLHFSVFRTFCGYRQQQPCHNCILSKSIDCIQCNEQRNDLLHTN